MKKLLVKSVLFFSLLLVIKSAFVVFYGDGFVYESTGERGNRFELKYRFDEFAKEDYDTVFIGSSRTAFDISPSYFDALTKRTKSYNFGIVAGLPPKTFDWCEELIKTKPSLKYVFFELSGSIELNADPAVAATTDRNNFLLTFFKPSVLQAEYDDVYHDFKLPLQNIPLEQFLNEKSVPATPSKLFSAQTIQLAQLRNSRIEEENLSDGSNINQVYWQRVSALIELAEAKQIHLYFFIPPRITSDRELNFIRPIYQRINEKYKFKVRHDDASLYQFDASLDNAHLNHLGAKKFTELLAETFAGKNF